MTLPQALFVDLRPPIPRSEMARLTQMSGGQLTWDKWGRSPETQFGVEIDYLILGNKDAANTMRFDSHFPPHLVVDQLQIGLPQEELFRRYPGLVVEEPVLFEDGRSSRPPPGTNGIWHYAGAFTGSGHEIEVTVKAARVIGFRISVPGYREAQHAWYREQLLNRKRIAEEIAARKREAKRLLGSLTTTPAEDDAMLSRWAREHGEAEARRLVRFLKKATPEERHAVVLTWNWDNGLAPLFWIIRRPDCDRATAIHVLTLGEPDDYVQFAGRVAAIPDVNLDGFWLTSEIFERWRRGCYPPAALALDAGFPPPSRVLDRGGTVHSVPPEMIAPVAGRTVSTEGYQEGFPPAPRRR